MAVYGYCRVSTSQQVEDGVSLEDQQRQIEGRCMERGWELSRLFIEKGISGGIPLAERPEGGRMLKHILAGDIVICPKLDRMFRSARDCLDVIDELKRRKVSLWLLDLGGDISGNGIGRLVVTIMSAVAEWERGRIGERIRDAKAYHRDTGQWSGGGIPFGYTPVEIDGKRKLAPVPEQQAIIAGMRQRRQAGETWEKVRAWANSQPGINLSLMGVHKIVNRDESKMPIAV